MDKYTQNKKNKQDQAHNVRLFCVDWITFYCTAGEVASSINYTIERKIGSSRQFRVLEDIYSLERSEVIASMERKPFSHIIEPTAVMLKIRNNVLYEKGWGQQVFRMCSELGLHIKSVSRIDLAFDLQRFDNKMRPAELIQSFLSNKILKNGRTSWVASGEQKVNQECHYLRFGKHDSDISVYIYNKSKELREEKDKPYIREMWQEGGLDITEDVWRLEVSIKPGNVLVGDENTGEYMKISPDLIEKYGILMDMAECILDKFFDFRKNDLTKNKSRMMRVELIKRFSASYILIPRTRSTVSTRSNKIFISHLAQIEDKLCIKESDVPESLKTALWEYSELTNLQSYALNKRLIQDRKNKKKRTL